MRICGAGAVLRAQATMKLKTNAPATMAIAILARSGGMAQDCERRIRAKVAARATRALVTTLVTRPAAAG